jgi:hypothetical protein
MPLHRIRPRWADTELVTPSIAIPVGGAQLTFRNLFNMEAPATGTVGYDGMVLEISIAGGAYADIITAGGVFVTGGYTRTISTAFMSPIAGRDAWSALSAGSTAAPAYITTSINMPAAASGQNIRLKWRAATDSSLAAAGVPGVRVDSIVIGQTSCGTPTPSPSGTASATPTCVPTGGWSAGAAFPAVGNVRAVGIYFPANGRFYHMGGRSSDTAGNNFANPFEYNPTTDTWVMKPLPSRMST